MSTKAKQFLEALKANDSLQAVNCIKESLGEEARGILVAAQVQMAEACGMKKMKESDESEEQEGYDSEDGDGDDEEDKEDKE
jgi:hypothetical protein